MYLHMKCRFRYQLIYNIISDLILIPTIEIELVIQEQLYGWNSI